MGDEKKALEFPAAAFFLSYMDAVADAEMRLPSSFDDHDVYDASMGRAHELAEIGRTAILNALTPEEKALLLDVHFNPFI